MLNVRNVMAMSGDIRDFMNVRYGVAGWQNMFLYAPVHYGVGAGFPSPNQVLLGKPLVKAASGLLEWLWGCG